MNCRAVWNQVIQRAADVVLPPVCLVCGEEMCPSHDGLMACPLCRRAMSESRLTACYRCASFYEPELHHASGCPRCQGEEFAFSGATALGIYENELRDCVLGSKQASHQALALLLGKLLGERRRSILRSWQPDLVVPIPLHWWRRVRHGYNNAEVIGEVVSREAGAAFEARLLQRTRSTRPQFPLSAAERRRNLQNAFRVRNEFEVGGSRVLLVDDILTTGTTCHEAARALHSCGAREIRVAVVARASDTSHG